MCIQTKYLNFCGELSIFHRKYEIDTQNIVKNIKHLRARHFGSLRAHLGFLFSLLN